MRIEYRNNIVNFHQFMHDVLYIHIFVIKSKCAIEIFNYQYWALNIDVKILIFYHFFETIYVIENVRVAFLYYIRIF